jgi:hypothetical protein
LQLSSYRKGGVLHNPINGKRTTKGVFHLAHYWLPIPAYKISVPLISYEPPDDLNYDQDMDLVESIIDRDYSDCMVPEFKAFHSNPSRPFLSLDRTLGSFIKSLTPDDVYTPEHNAFVEQIPNHI